MGGKEIRLISGYGPQETWNDEEKMPFFVALEEEIIKAQYNEKSIITAMDANSKLGMKYIENDPKPMSSNGKILGYMTVDIPVTQGHFRSFGHSVTRSLGHSII